MSAFIVLAVLAILCGVAVGLTSVAVGVILVVKNRSGATEEAHEGDGGGGSLVGGSGGSSSGGDSGGGDGRGKYDAVSTKGSDDGRGHCARDRQMARCGE